MKSMVMKSLVHFCHHPPLTHNNGGTRRMILRCPQRSAMIKCGEIPSCSHRLGLQRLRLRQHAQRRKKWTWLPQARARRQTPCCHLQKLAGPRHQFLLVLLLLLLPLHQFPHVRIILHPLEASPRGPAYDQNLDIELGCMRVW